MYKKILVLLTIAFILAGCGDNYYKVDSNSELTKDDMIILQKNYEDLDQAQQSRASTLHLYMTADELEKFEDDLRRLFIGEMASLGSTNEEADKEVFSNNFDYTLRKLKGELTEEEIKEEEDRKNNLEATRQEETEARREIQENLDLINNSDSKIETLNIESYSNVGKVEINFVIDSLQEITVGEIVYTRISIVDAIMDVVDKEGLKVLINLYLGEEYKDTYTFELGMGWDKDVTP
ncbi:hypothetical protein HYG86_09190 [Alkalicella caledoniensis]|uniref:Uncharacterized protein n=1 Tax=Alkalicella caledoniensis TaxID=2731377 RepID=A0A7G9W8C3_ALKCA|nr:hypothetical protein [Alkalicella caledoniensis]QNO14935.1 hypothetical protein HYG86_09190 [Alkalicella caledoniensis]